MLIVKFAYDSLLKIRLRLTHLQETVADRNTVEGLLPRMAVLEARFATCPGDTAEQRRRNELIWHVVVPRSDLILISFQHVQGHRRTAGAFIREARPTATF